MMVSCVFVFCKQKTAYEMRSSDWSSDVCPSDLFGRDRRLTRAVVDDGQLVDQVARVARRIVHRGHRRTLFGGGVLKDALEDLDRDVAREQIGENRFLVGFIFDRGAARCRNRSEEHTSELQSLMRISYAVFCLKKKI